MKKAIGILILVVLFFFIVVVQIRAYGWKKVLLAYGVLASIAALMWLAVKLITS